MTANTIVSDTQKDLRFVFDQPVQAVAFRLLTNNVAHEVVNFKDVSGGTFNTVDIDRFTPRNDRPFVLVRRQYALTQPQRRRRQRE